MVGDEKYGGYGEKFDYYLCTQDKRNVNLFDTFINFSPLWLNYAQLIH